MELDNNLKKLANFIQVLSVYCREVAKKLIMALFFQGQERQFRVTNQVLCQIFEQPVLSKIQQNRRDSAPLKRDLS